MCTQVQIILYASASSHVHINRVDIFAFINLNDQLQNNFNLISHYNFEIHNKKFGDFAVDDQSTKDLLF